MPTNLNLKIGVGFEGRAVGVSTNTAIATPMGPTTVLTSLLGSGKQVYERWLSPITMTTTGVTTINLLSGLSNPLGESISGTLAFGKILAVQIHHDTASPSPAVEAFGGTVGSLFQGPLGVTAAVTVTRGACFGFNMPASQTGWSVNSTAKNIELRNLGTTVATVKVLIAGIL